jgi:hypothetical protein
MKGIYTLCDEPDAARRAVDGLSGLGLTPSRITVLSSEPFEHEIFEQEGETRIQWIAVAGGAVGCALTIALLILVQNAWPLNTGGMPIVSMFANMIPIFELTMLSAIVATVVAFLVTARLPGRMSDLYDPAVSDGRILVGVASPPDDGIEDIRAVLASHGELKTLR